MSKPARQSKSPAPNQLQIGENIRQMRLSREITLGRLAEQAQVSKSNLSKIENGIISPTFDMIDKISRGLGIPAAAVLSPELPGQEILSFTDRGEGMRSEKDSYEFEFLFAELKDRKMVPFVTTVRPHQSEDVAALSSHDGEEFFTVLEGSVEFRSGSGISRVMSTGDSVYFNSNVQHLVVNNQEQEARLLWVWLA